MAGNSIPGLACRGMLTPGAAGPAAGPPFVCSPKSLAAKWREGAQTAHKSAPAATHKKPEVAVPVTLERWATHRETEGWTECIHQPTVTAMAKAASSKESLQITDPDGPSELL